MENLLKIDQKPGNMNDNQEEKNELKPLSQDPLLERKSICNNTIIQPELTHF